MLQEVMAHSGLAVFAEIALLLFIAAFVCIAIRTWRRKPEADKRMARMPLDDDGPHHGGNSSGKV